MSSAILTKSLLAIFPLGVMGMVEIRKIPDGRLYGT
jgi:hypothetical protein